MMMQFGECLTACSVTLLTISVLAVTRSSRLMPGPLGLPDVMMTMSEPAVSSQSFVPTTLLSKPSKGPAWVMSRAFPCGKPSITSMRTMSA